MIRYKVIAFWKGSLTEEIFYRKEDAQEFAHRLVANDISSCPRIIEIED